MMTSSECPSWIKREVRKLYRRQEYNMYNTALKLDVSVTVIRKLVQEKKPTISEIVHNKLTRSLSSLKLKGDL